MENTIEKNNGFQKKLIRGIFLLLGLIVIAGLFLYYQFSSTRVAIDKAQIAAPSINLSATAPGILENIFVEEGQKVDAYSPVAQIGDAIVKTKVSGIIISVEKNNGQMFAAGQTVVTMIDPNEFGVVGTIDENKGLDKLKVGQVAYFTVDAFGSKKYEGIVEEISPTSHASGVVFNISDKRETKTFDVKIKFDSEKYPELKNGMSAKITIFI